MSAFDDAAGTPSSDSFHQEENTVGWLPPMAAADPVTRPAPTAAQPAASTPGPQAPEYATRADTADQMAQQRAAMFAARGALPHLPPIPGYDVQRYIGRGGMGVVYQAVQLATGRTVALKIVNPSGAQDRVTRERFAREVRTLAALKHPNIVPVYDAGDWHGFPYCAMEFVTGGTLSHHIDRIRADLRGAVVLMVRTTRAIAAMHAAGVLHRDIKPLNILLGDNDEPMVADFGLARWADDDSDLTNTGWPVGTRQYMAPEQTLGNRDNYTSACDVWAIGVTLYEVLTGSRPFNDDGITDIFNRIRFEDPPSLASLAPAVPPALAAVVFKCLEKRPEDRYASAAEVADDLERWLAGTVVLAPPVPVPVPTIRAKRSRRSRVLLAAAGVVAVAVGIVVLGGAFRKHPPTPKTLAERVAAGEKVKLTDEKGVPTVPWSQTGGHVLHENPLDDFHGFTSKGVGLVALADEAWGGPIRVEADVAVVFDTDLATTGGVYVGRRQWAGAEFKHESLVWAGVRPREPLTETDIPQVGCLAELYWWDRNHTGSHATKVEKLRPWSPDGKGTPTRFVRVVIEVRATEIRTNVDGIELPSIAEDWALDELKRKPGERPQLPRFTFDKPVFGTGIGVYCRHADCAVINLTVSKLDP